MPLKSNTSEPGPVVWRGVYDEVEVPISCFGYFESREGSEPVGQDPRDESDVATVKLCEAGTRDTYWYGCKEWYDESNGTKDTSPDNYVVISIVSTSPLGLVSAAVIPAAETSLGC